MKYYILLLLLLSYLFYQRNYYLLYYKMVFVIIKYFFRYNLLIFMSKNIQSAIFHAHNFIVNIYTLNIIINRI